MPFDGLGYDSKLPKWKRITGYFLKPIEIPNRVDYSEDAIQILKIGRVLIIKEKHWIQNVYETSKGKRCAVGAIRTAARYLGFSQNSLEFELARRTLKSISSKRGFRSIQNMNDLSCHSQVIDDFDRAITLLKNKH